MNINSIAIMMKRATIEFDWLANNALAPFNLTASQYKIVKFIAAQPENTVKQIDIEKYFSLSNPTVTGIIQKLEKNGVVHRTQNREDKRSKVICLTEKWFDMKADLYKIGEEMENSFTQNLSEEEKEQLFYLLKKMMNKEDKA